MATFHFKISFPTDHFKIHYYYAFLQRLGLNTRGGGTPRHHSMSSTIKSESMTVTGRQRRKEIFLNRPRRLYVKHNPVSSSQWVRLHPSAFQFASGIAPICSSLTRVRVWSNGARNCFKTSMTAWLHISPPGGRQFPMGRHLYPTRWVIGRWWRKTKSVLAFAPDL